MPSGWLTGIPRSGNSGGDPFSNGEYELPVLPRSASSSEEERETYRNRRSPGLQSPPLTAQSTNGGRRSSWNREQTPPRSRGGNSLRTARDTRKSHHVSRMRTLAEASFLAGLWADRNVPRLDSLSL